MAITWDMTETEKEIYGLAANTAKKAFSQNKKMIMNAWEIVLWAERTMEEANLWLLNFCPQYLTQKMPFDSLWEEILRLMLDTSDAAAVVEYLSNDLYTREPDPATYWVFMLYMFCMKKVEIYSKTFGNERVETATLWSMIEEIVPERCRAQMLEEIKQY